MEEEIDSLSMNAVGSYTELLRITMVDDDIFWSSHCFFGVPGAWGLIIL